jgi:hypothetical protein
MSVFIGAVSKSEASKIKNKVIEVNNLINEAKSLDAYVTDPSSTWESQYDFKPYKYSRGVLFESYRMNDGRGWTKRSERYSTFDAMIVLNQVARFLRSAIRKEKKYL